MGFSWLTTRKHLYKLFDLEVKGQGNNVVMMVHDIPSDDYTPIYQISLTYLKRQKSYGPER
jgi:hypothetical protein